MGNELVKAFVIYFFCFDEFVTYHLWM